MRVLTLASLALASAAFGAALTGWTVRSASQPLLNQAVLSNTGYGGPAGVPLGEWAGGIAPHGAVDMPNPLGNSPTAIANGKRLFSAMNCAGCHGYDGGGGMGPPLNDSYWRFGGTPVEIYKTLYEGRPKGMPAWGTALPPEDLWQLTAYVTSLGGGFKPSRADNSRQGDDLNGKTSKAGSGTLEGQ